MDSHALEVAACFSLLRASLQAVKQECSDTKGLTTLSANLDFIRPNTQETYYSSLEVLVLVSRRRVVHTKMFLVCSHQLGLSPFLPSLHIQLHTQPNHQRLQEQNQTPLWV